ITARRALVIEAVARRSEPLVAVAYDLASRLDEIPIGRRGNRALRKLPAVKPAAAFPSIGPARRCFMGTGGRYGHGEDGESGAHRSHLHAADLFKHLASARRRIAHDGGRNVLLGCWPYWSGRLRGGGLARRCRLVSPLRQGDLYPAVLDLFPLARQRRLAAIDRRGLVTKLDVVPAALSRLAIFDLGLGRALVLAQPDEAMMFSLTDQDLDAVLVAPAELLCRCRADYERHAGGRTLGLPERNLDPGPDRSRVDLDNCLCPSHHAASASASAKGSCPAISSSPPSSATPSMTCDRSLLAKALPSLNPRCHS